LISLAALDVAEGDIGAARRHIRQALDRTGDEVAVVLNAGLLSEQLGDLDEARDLFAVTLMARPSAAALAVWDDPARRVQKAVVLARAREWADPLVGSLILAYAGRPADARRELQAMTPSPTRDLYAAAASWLDGDLAGAVEELQSMLSRNPLDYEAAGWLAGILRTEGDPRAGTYLRWVRLVQADIGPAVARNVTARIASTDESGFGLPGHYPWAVYVRASGGNLLVPSLTLIGSP
jgi:hypothetical protein